MDQEQRGKKLYSYPILKLHEIVASLRSLNIAFVEDDLRSCQPDALRKILEEFIRNTMGIGRDEMSQPALVGLSELTVQLHSGSVGEITYFRTISRLLATAGLRDFRWDDVYKPTLKRYRRILSALINFTRFRYERWARVGQNEDKLVRIRAERQTAEEENATLRRQLADLQSEQSAEAEALQSAMDESSALEDEIYTLNKRQAVVRHENTGLKAQCGHLRDEYASLRIDISEAKATVNKLESKIVSSPARFKSDIGDISVKVDAAKEELALLEARTTELDSIYDAFARADQETNAAVDLMHETEVESQSCRNEKKNIKAQHHEIESTFHKTKQAVAHHARLHKLVLQRNSQLEQYKMQHSTKLQAADNALASATTELKDFLKTNRAMEQSTQTTSNATHELKRHASREESVFRHRMQEMDEANKDHCLRFMT